MTMSTSRREFMRRAAILAGAGAASPLALNLAAMSSASAQSAGNDYKALVCLFMYGGNDHSNTVVPLDVPTHDIYASRRGAAVALTLDEMGTATELVPDNPWTDGRTSGRRMALHPSMTAVKGLFDQGKLAMAMNVGTLVAPVTDYNTTPNSGLPPKLFSHNDQQSVWQAGLAEGATSGWGGRMVEKLVDTKAPEAAFVSISAAGNAVFMSGKEVVQYQMGAPEPIAVNPLFGSSASADALKQIMQRPSAQLFEADHAAVASRSISMQKTISSALGDGGIKAEWFAPLKALADLGNPLAAQLNIVAHLIAARAGLGVKRQVFFVSMGGFDLHDTLKVRHAPLLQAVSDAMAAFYAVTANMSMQDQVTTFTGSDFGRTLVGNNDGSDHAWGSHQMVMGGAVKGKRWYGELPLMSYAPEDDPVGRGRLVPKMAVDQLGATMGRWMGLTTEQLVGTAAAGYKDAVFPNLNRFGSSDMGFMTL